MSRLKVLKRYANMLSSEGKFIVTTAEPKRLVKEHMSGKSDNYKILFSLVVFEEWLRTCL
ncbi:unnamed protein product [marine sediment metagenome]|uniref:Uncharacterized protein n=1 Tax=marine sediment metagenome TaxID=412755 RepID=X1QI58_9ZZZZ